MVWPCPCLVSDLPPTHPPLTLLIKYALNVPVYILSPSTRPDSCNGHKKVSNALPEPDRSHLHLGSYTSAVPDRTCSPSSQACLVLLPVLQLFHAAVCAATKLSVRCSQDLHDHLTIFPILSQPARRTGCNNCTHTQPYTLLAHTNDITTTTSSVYNY